MNNLTKPKGQINVPLIYIAILSKRSIKINGITLEEMISLIRNIPNMGINAKTLLISYFIAEIILLWGAQAKSSGKFNVQAKGNLTSEKLYQQTNTHNIMTKLIGSSEPVRTLISVHTIMSAIKKDYFGKTDEERSSNESYSDAVVVDFDDIKSQKGSGTTKIYVHDPETRRAWLRGTNSSLRSTWCSIPTFSPSTLVKTYNVKTITPKDIEIHFDYIIGTLVENNTIEQQDIPTFQEVEDACREVISNLNIDTNINDNDYGKIPPIALDKIFDFVRIDKEKSNPIIALPELAKLLKGVPAR